MTPTLKRHWFAFSLRTMFVVVTLLSCWLGWNARIVQQREIMRALERREMASKVIWRMKFVEAIPQGSDPQRMAGRRFLVNVKEHATQPVVSSRLSLIRRWLGDRPVVMVLVKNKSDHDQVIELFPESAVFLMPRQGPVLGLNFPTPSTTLESRDNAARSSH